MTDENGRRTGAGREGGPDAGGARGDARERSGEKLPILPDGAERSLTEAASSARGYGGVPDGVENGGRRARLGESARNALICAVLAVCLATLLIPAVVTGVRADAAYAGGTLSRALCRIMITSALPPTDRPLWARWVDEETDGTRPAGTDPAAPEETGGAGSSAAESRPEDADPVVSGQETVGPGEVGADETTSGAPDDPEPDTGGETDGDETVSEHDPSVPVPARPVVISRDMSESEGGARRTRNDTDFDPAGLTPGYDGTASARPVVLVTSSHPFEAYTDGGTTGEQASALAGALRARGMTVILIGPAASGITAETSFVDAYERTRAQVRYNCLLYADAPVLVIDVRRSAELTEAGGIGPASGSSGLLRTVGTWNGQPTAQLRLIVDAYRGGTGAGAASGRTVPADWRLAQAVRDRLFALSPTVSRPVWIRAGTGLLPTDPADPAAGRTPPLLLTAELGAAGNTSGEASPLVGLLARAVAELVK